MLTDDEFVRQHEDLVRSVAQKTRAQLSLECDLEDLVAFGFRGLLEARHRFDDTRGVRFASFAYYRVRGAIMDGVRQMAYMPRRAYARMRAIETLDDEAQTVGETRDTSPQMRGDVDASLRAVDAVLGRVAASYTIAVVSDDEAWDTASPETQVAHKQSRERALSALSRLSDREQSLLRGVYFEGRTLEDMGKELGMSKSWASRVHGKALTRLREAMGAEPR